LVNFWLILTLC